MDPRANKPYSVEVCFSPASFHRFKNKNANVVVVDILRATSAICTAFHHGVQKIIPVATIEEAREYKNKGYLIAAERDGIVLDFADFGNSPYNFMGKNLEGKSIVYSTTNGTKAIHMAEDCNQVLIGSYLNFSTLTRFLLNDKHDVIILCAGWKDRFSLEDSLFAGALAEALTDSGDFCTICDSSIAAIDLWSIAKKDIRAYIEKAAQRHRLKNLGLDDVLDYCHTFDVTKVLPVFKDNIITDN